MNINYKTKNLNQSELNSIEVFFYQMLIRLDEKAKQKTGWQNVSKETLEFLLKEQQKEKNSYSNVDQANLLLMLEDSFRKHNVKENI